jgi:hypothetical protein
LPFNPDRPPQHFDEPAFLRYGYADVLALPE